MITQFNEHGDRKNRFIRESNDVPYFNVHNLLVIKMESKEELDKIFNYIKTEIEPVIHKNVNNNHYNGIKNTLRISDSITPNLVYDPIEGFLWGDLDYTLTDVDNGRYNIGKIYTVNDLIDYGYIIKNNRFPQRKPRYMLSPEERKKRFIRESYIKNYSDDYSHVVIEITNLQELTSVYDFLVSEINPIIENNVKDEFFNGIRNYLNNGKLGNFIYYIGENYMRYGSKEYTINNPMDFKIEKFYKPSEIKDFKYIIENDKYPQRKPNYMLSSEERKKRFIRENNQYFEEYPCIIIEFENKKDIDKTWEYIDKNDIGIIPESLKHGSYKYIEQGYTPVFVYIRDGNNWMYGNKDYILNNPEQNPHKKFYTIGDLNEIKRLISGVTVPKYMMTPEERNKRFIRENYNDFLLEKSSLTKLGVPREVMQPIQKDLALSPNVEWEKYEHKKDVISELKNGEANLFVQIELHNIKVFVSFPSPKGIQYFVDNYVYRDTDWSGEFEKLKREYKTLTQLSVEIEPRSNIYKLDGEFSINKQQRRRMIKTEKTFVEFPDKFKSDFLKKFDKILKRISGTNFEKAKDKITDKAKKIAMENSLLIKGLDNPLTGPNGLSILDEFILQFENEYTKYFKELVDIQELSNYFTRDKLMMMFMYYIYTGKILTK